MNITDNFLGNKRISEFPCELNKNRKEKNEDIYKQKLKEKKKQKKKDKKVNKTRGAIKAPHSLSKKFESSLKLKHRVSKGITSLWSGQGLTALVGCGAKPHI